jgi:hypothetical protein
MPREIDRFVDRPGVQARFEPQTAIDGLDQGVIVNLTDHRADASRRDQVELLKSLGPDKIAREYSRLQAPADGPVSAGNPKQPTLPHLVTPAHHDVRPATRRRGAGAPTSPPLRNADRKISPICFWFLGPGGEPFALSPVVAEAVHGAPYRSRAG